MSKKNSREAKAKRRAERLAGQEPHAPVQPGETPCPCCGKPGHETLWHLPHPTEHAPTVRQLRERYDTVLARDIDGVTVTAHVG